MTLTVSGCAEIIRWALGNAEPGTPLETLGIINHAGQWLTSVHQWEWLKNRPADLTIRPSITLTSASWTAATRTLTSTGSFASYSFVTGDKVEITGGTGATEGIFEIASKTDSNSVVLVESISASDIASGITATLDNDLVVVPNGLQQITAYAPSNGLVNTFSLSTPQEMLALRTASPGLTTLSFWGFLSWVQSTGNQPDLRLEVWPPNTTGGRLLRIWYTSSWVDLEDDNAVVPVPDFMNFLFLEACKAVAKGNDMENQGSVLERLDAIERSQVFLRLKERDGMQQVDFGAISGGALDTTNGGWSVFDQERRVTNP